MLKNFTLFAQVATVQGLSGTGSLRLAGAFIHRYFPDSKAMISSPTWGTQLFYLILLFSILLYLLIHFFNIFYTYEQEITRIFSTMPGFLGLNIVITILEQ